MTQQFFAAIYNNTTNIYSGNDELIFGIGATPEAALADALRQTEPGTPAEEYRALPCSEALYTKVEREGGQVAFERVQGRLVLASEVE